MDITNAALPYLGPCRESCEMFSHFFQNCASEINDVILMVDIHKLFSQVVCITPLMYDVL